jgi:hypothetical protein
VHLGCSCGIAAGLLLLNAADAHAAGNVWSRLGSVVRLELLLALLGLMLVGLALFVLVRLSASFARRRMRDKRARSRLGPDNWAARRFLKRPPTHEPRRDEPRAD